MTYLRQKMIDAMLMHGFSPRTHKCYLAAVSGLAKYYSRSPDQISIEEIERYFLYLIKTRHLAPASCNQYFNAIRFLYLKVLGWEAFDIKMTLPKCPQRIPELLTRKDINSILEATSNAKHKMLLLCCYACGLRVSEVVAIQIRHIDGERQLLRVEQGKGMKDRYVPMSDHLLHALRTYWSQYHPGTWLFFSSHRKGNHLAAGTAQKFYTTAKRAAKIEKIGGIHGLRHAYATHQLEAGTPVHWLQRQMGHANIKTTLRYIHWIHNYQVSDNPAVDLVSELEVRDE
ncbi:MAG: tyrosine-type recombinase/integrase [Gammaproteobacteria bacterium]|nr:tyrosine-type recombinase/integrase [Gammaproteobacteria bacterium]